jgi:glycosyltransferase involved in cell wall biosynthesis
MKVLAVSRNFPNPVRPFEGTWACTQFKALTEYGADVRVLSPRLVNFKTLLNPSELSYFVRRPGEWVHAGLKTFGPKVFLWKASSKLRHTYAQQYRKGVQKLVADIHRQWPFDVIYTQAINPDAVVALELARRHNAIAAGCIIGQAEVAGAVEDPVLRKMTIETIKELDCVFAESAEVARIAGELTGNCRPIHPLHRGTFPEDMTIHPEISSRWKKQFGFPHESVVVMFVGHLYKAKGVLDLLDAFRSVHDEFPAARLVFVGTGNQDKVLKGRVRSYSLDGMVYFTGPVPYDHIPSLMNLADFLCSPSHSEGLGLVNVEAGFCGKAVVGARTGGIPEAVCDGRTGLLFEPGNVDQLAEKLRMMLEDEDMRRRMGEAAKAFVAEHHDAHKNTKLLYDRLNEAVRHRKLNG